MENTTRQEGQEILTEAKKDYARENLIKNLKARIELVEKEPINYEKFRLYGVDEERYLNLYLTASGVIGTSGAIKAPDATEKSILTDPNDPLANVGR